MAVDIREYLNSHKFTVLFSGGKDSTAVLLWVLDNVHHEDWNILYVEVSGNTHPLCNQYVHDITKELGVRHKLIHAKREDMDFFEALKKWGIPLFGKRRWCMYQFKQKLFQKHSHMIQVIGIRRSDSQRRKKARMFEVFRQTNNVSVKPILSWNEKQVREYIRSHGIGLNPCYEICGHSGNCMFCPFHNKKQIILTMSLPEWREKILDALRVQKPNGRMGKKILNYWMKYGKQQTLLISK